MFERNWSKGIFGHSVSKKQSIEAKNLIKNYFYIKKQARLSILNMVISKLRIINGI